MEQRHVYHHHYHHHYTYPFPPGLPPNAPQNNASLNQEVAERENDETPAENEGEEEAENEHSERDDTEGQQNSETRSPSPVQEDTEFTEYERSAYVVFAGSLDYLDLDKLSLEAQARFTNTQPSNDDHQEGPPRKKARTSSYPGQQNNPRGSNHITVIDKARIVATDGSFHVVNCDPTGPQIDICWRVPDHRNIWLARVGYVEGSKKKLRALIKAQAPPDLPLLSYLQSQVDEENALSLIECSCGDQNYVYFEDGGGRVVPGDSLNFEFLSALGRMVGFEVVRG
ncbi:hypothetical protein F52700_6280 [Fusarium sp. NRRL 52700]|nr:hypothetical protein F52700_6280 [Fusarium sp. NRRL 52700]